MIDSFEKTTIRKIGLLVRREGNSQGHADP
jgi:hypothetical protein